MQPLTEETGRSLVAALEKLTEAITRGQCPNVAVSDGAYIARSVMGGIEGIKAENKVNRTGRKIK